MSHRSGITRSLGNPPSGLKSRTPTEIPLRRQAKLTLYIQNDEAPCPGVARKGGDGWQLSTLASA